MAESEPEKRTRTDLGMPYFGEAGVAKKVLAEYVAGMAREYVIGRGYDSMFSLSELVREVNRENPAFIRALIGLAKIAAEDEPGFQVRAFVYGGITSYMLVRMRQAQLVEREGERIRKLESKLEDSEYGLKRARRRALEEDRKNLRDLEGVTVELMKAYEILKKYNLLGELKRGKTKKRKSKGNIIEGADDDIQDIIDALGPSDAELKRIQDEIVKERKNSRKKKGN